MKIQKKSNKIYLLICIIIPIIDIEKANQKLSWIYYQFKVENHQKKI